MTKPLHCHPSSRKAMILAQADDKYTESIVDRYLHQRTHKTFTPAFFFDLKPAEKKIYSLQRELYEHSISKNSKFRYESSTRFPNEKSYGAKVVCTKKILPQEHLKKLAGQCFFIHEDDIREGINDFSMLYSNRKNSQMIFLGPAAYVNHDCESNCTWASLVSKSYVHLKACKCINPGEEITAYYGNDFFGENNENCRCNSCEIKGIGYFKKQEVQRAAADDNHDNDNMAVRPQTPSITKEVHRAAADDGNDNDNDDDDEDDLIGQSSLVQRKNTPPLASSCDDDDDGNADDDKQVQRAADDDDEANISANTKKLLKFADKALMALSVPRPSNVIGQSSLVQRKATLPLASSSDDEDDAKHRQLGISSSSHDNDNDEDDLIGQCSSVQRRATLPLASSSDDEDDAKHRQLGISSSSHDNDNDEDDLIGQCSSVQRRATLPLASSSDDEDDAKHRQLGISSSSHDNDNDEDDLIGQCSSVQRRATLPLASSDDEEDEEEDEDESSDVDEDNMNLHMIEMIKSNFNYSYNPYTIDNYFALDFN